MRREFTCRVNCCRLSLPFSIPLFPLPPSLSAKANSSKWSLKTLVMQARRRSAFFSAGGWTSAGLLRDSRQSTVGLLFKDTLARGRGKGYTTFSFKLKHTRGWLCNKEYFSRSFSSRGMIADRSSNMPLVLALSLFGSVSVFIITVRRTVWADEVETAQSLSQKLKEYSHVMFPVYRVCSIFLKRSFSTLCIDTQHVLDPIRCGKYRQLMIDLLNNSLGILDELFLL